MKRAREELQEKKEIFIPFDILGNIFNHYLFFNLSIASQDGEEGLKHNYEPEFISDFRPFFTRRKLIFPGGGGNTFLNLETLDIDAAVLATVEISGGDIQGCYSRRRITPETTKYSIKKTTNNNNGSPIKICPNYIVGSCQYGDCDAYKNDLIWRFSPKFLIISVSNSSSSSSNSSFSSNSCHSYSSLSSSSSSTT
jgi:hypothetical protein